MLLDARLACAPVMSAPVPAACVRSCGVCRLGGGELRLRLLERDAERRRVDAEQQSPALDLIAVLDRDLGDRAVDLRADGDDVLLHRGIVGRDVAAARNPPVIARRRAAAAARSASASTRSRRLPAARARAAPMAAGVVLLRPRVGALDRFPSSSRSCRRPVLARPAATLSRTRASARATVQGRCRRSPSNASSTCRRRAPQTSRQAVLPWPSLQAATPGGRRGRAGVRPVLLPPAGRRSGTG